MSEQGSAGGGGGSSGDSGGGSGGGGGGGRRRRRGRRGGRRGGQGQGQGQGQSQGGGGGGPGGSQGGGPGGSTGGGPGGTQQQTRRKQGGGGNRQGGAGGGGGNRRRGKPQRGGGQRAGGQRRGGRPGGGGGRRGGGGSVQRWNQKQPEYLPGGEIPTECDGISEIMPDSSGFLRRMDRSLLAQHDDIYIPPALVRQFNIGTGSRIVGKVGEPTRSGQRPHCSEIETIDGIDPDEYKLRIPIKHLTSIDPEKWMKLEGKSKDVTTRIIDLLSPIGFGQRCLIVAPPRAGKTVIMQRIGAALNEYYPDVDVIILLINERPEEVTDIRRTIDGDVIASSLDDLAPSHVAVSEMAFSRAQRLVEQGRDVVMLVDSLTRMARAYNMEIGSSSRTLSGGLDSRAMEHPKRHFGCARNVEGGGSLTVIATALIDTGSRMDQVIFEEFKGTGNAEIVLNRKLAELRIWPALDLSKSGTRKEEKIVPDDILKLTWTLRRVLGKLKPEEAMELLVDKLETTTSNRDFLEHFHLK